MARQNQAMQDLLRYNTALLNTKRSQFDKSHSHATTFDSGYLIPIMWDRVVPGDEKKIRYSGLARMATPIHPVMDEAYLYTWAFYIPDRLWWTHAKEFYGENLDASFNPDGEYEMPNVGPDKYVVISDTYYDEENDEESIYHGIGSLHDYLGYPVVDRAVYNSSIDGFDSSSKPGLNSSVGLQRSYQIIWNEYFRNSSIQPAVRVNTGDDAYQDSIETFKLRKVCKLPDMFTSLLREPQAGADVLLPLGEYAPVVSDPNGPADTWTMLYGDYNGTSTWPASKFGTLGYGPVKDDDFEFAAVGVVNPDSFAEIGSGNQTFFNLYTDLRKATSTTINNLRAAVTVQQLLERDAMAGKRYQNILQAHFGVFTADATLQRPELLGLSKTRIGMRQTLTTSEANGAHVGDAGAVSVTNVDNEWICNKGFTEPGFIMVLAAVRPLHSYSQGLNPLLTKLDRYDHFWQVFDNLGNQPVFKHNILFAEHNVRHGEGNFNYDTAMEVFGYKEAWQEYRMIDNRVSGLFRPDVEGSLASWNYSTYLEKYPVLNSAFVSEDPQLIDRTIAVETEPQFLLDSYFEYYDTKSMSVHSTPGLRFF